MSSSKSILLTTFILSNAESKYETFKNPSCPG